MRRPRCWGERKGRSVSVTFFSRRLAERAGWQPRRGDWRRTGRRAGRSVDEPLAPKRRSRRAPGRAFQSRVAAVVEAESELPREPAQQAERPCPTWNQNGRPSTRLPDLMTSPCILPKRGLGCTFRVGALSAGLMSAIRNPTAHEPAVDWPISLDDCLDILSFISFLYRQLDKAVYFKA